jgi:LysR family nod box-dependent transcriptional activator
VRRPGSRPAADGGRSQMQGSVVVLLGLDRRRAHDPTDLELEVGHRRLDPVGPALRHLESLRLWDDRWDCIWEGNTRVGKRMTMERYTALGHLIYSMGGAGQPVALPDMHLGRLGVPRRIEVSVESFLLAPFLLQGTDLVTLIPKRAEAFLRRTGDIRVLESPIELPALVETLWWHSRATADPAHAWLRTRIGEVASTVIT